MTFTKVNEVPGQYCWTIHVSICQYFTCRIYLAISPVVNNGSLDTVSASYLKDVLHVSLVQAAFLPPLRIAGVTVLIFA
jgi:hypothetical protein